MSETMRSQTSSKRPGFFTRLPDEMPPAEPDRLTAEQIADAKHAGSRDAETVNLENEGEEHIPQQPGPSNHLAGLLQTAARHQ